MSNIILGIIPPNSPAGVEDRMSDWLVHSGMDAELETISVESADGLVENVEFEINESPNKVLGILLDQAHFSADQYANLEKLFKAKQISVHNLK